MHFTRSYDNQWIRTRQRGTLLQQPYFFLNFHEITIKRQGPQSPPLDGYLCFCIVYIHYCDHIRGKRNDDRLKSSPAVTYSKLILLGLSALVDFSSPAFIKGYTTKERDLSWSIAYSGRLTSHPSSNRHSVTVKEYLVCYHFAVAFFAVLCV